MYSRNDITLKDAIENMIDTFNLREQYNQARLLQNWEKIVGKTIAKYTTDVAVKDQKLYIYMSSSPLKQEMFIMREKIVELENEFFKSETIKEVNIK